MGNVTLGIPEDLKAAVLKTAPYRTFVETGTYRCGTALWAAEYFEVVHTVEMHEDYFSRARNGLAGHKNVQVHFGDSRTKLVEVVAGIHEPAVFWLDAHWAGNYELSVGSPGECPLMDELRVFRTRDYDDVILIDDARLFNAPPPRPHDPAQWPTRIDILVETGHWPGPLVEVAEWEDVLVIARPPALGRIMAAVGGGR